MKPQRLIDANALKEWFPDSGEGSWTYNVTVKACIDAQPTVEAEPVRHGKWIFNPKDAIEMMFTLPKCSECGAESADGGNYCPNCGADMRGESDD